MRPDVKLKFTKLGQGVSNLVRDLRTDMDLIHGQSPVLEKLIESLSTPTQERDRGKEISPVTLVDTFVDTAQKIQNISQRGLIIPSYNQIYELPRLKIDSSHIAIMPYEVIDTFSVVIAILREQITGGMNDGYSNFYLKIAERPTTEAPFDLLKEKPLPLGLDEWLPKIAKNPTWRRINPQDFLSQVPSSIIRRISEGVVRSRLL